MWGVEALCFSFVVHFLSVRKGSILTHFVRAQLEGAIAIPLSSDPALPLKQAE